MWVEAGNISKWQYWDYMSGYPVVQITWGVKYNSTDTNVHCIYSLTTNYYLSYAHWPWLACHKPNSYNKVPWFSQICRLKSFKMGCLRPKQLWNILKLAQTNFVYVQWWQAKAYNMVNDHGCFAKTTIAAIKYFILYLNPDLDTKIH